MAETSSAVFYRKYLTGIIYPVGRDAIYPTSTNILAGH